MAASSGMDEHDDPVTTRPDIEVVPDADERRVRARRIRERAQELIDVFGHGHPLVAEALDRADALEDAADRSARLDPGPVDQGRAGG